MRTVLKKFSEVSILFFIFIFVDSKAQSNENNRLIDYLREFDISYSKLNMINKNQLLYKDKKTKKWGALGDYLEVSPQADKIIFPYINHADSLYLNSTIFKLKNKYAIIQNEDFFAFEDLKRNLLFDYDEIDPEIVTNTSNNTYFLKAKRNKRWGIINVYNGVPVTSFTYSSKNDLENAIDLGLEINSFEIDQYENILGILKNSNYETIIPINSEDPVFLVEENNLWGLAYQNKPNKLKISIPIVYEKITLEEAYDYSIPAHIVLTKNQQLGYACLCHENIDITFDNISDYLQFGFEDIELVKKNNTEYAVTKKDGKWGFIEPYSGIILSDFIYENPEDVPLYLLDEYEITEMQKILKSLPVSKVEFDKNNGDGVFRAKLKETGKWGMYQGYNGNYNNLIPAKYDEINFFSWNGNFSIVKNNEKYGVVLSPWSNDDLTNLETIPCQYEDYKIIEYESEKHPGYTDKFIAFKQKEKWAFVNYKNGKAYSEFVYDSPEDLPYPLSK